MDARLVWREIEPGIKLTWIPKKQTFINPGFVSFIHNKKVVYVYKFNKPKAVGEDWRRFEMEYVETFDWTEGCIAVKDHEIQEIYALVPIGTPILITP